MNWNNGFTSSFYVTVVDRDSWEDTDRIEIMDGKVNRSSDDLMQSADFTCRDFPVNQELLVRIYCDAIQSGESVHEAIFTGFATLPQREYEGRLKEHPVKCCSLLQAAEDVLLPVGWYAPIGIDGAQLVKRLLGVTGAPIEVAEGSTPLSAAIISEDKENHLSMSLKILKAIGWRLRISGYGRIEVCPMAQTPVAQYDPFTADGIKPRISVSDDWYKCPNVFRAISGDSVAVARDDSPDSALSTVSRGREVWESESSCDFAENESIAHYAMRRLNELQKVAFTVKYDRRYNPRIAVGDLIWLNYPEQDVVGVFESVSQSVDLSPGMETAEEVQKVNIDIYTASEAIGTDVTGGFGRMVLPDNVYAVMPDSKRVKVYNQ